MGFKDILVHVDSTAASTARVWVSLALARRSNARVVGLHVTPNPHVPLYFKPSHAERIAKLYKESADEAAVLAEIQFRKDVKDAGVETQWELAQGDIARGLAEHGCLADLLVVGQDDTENPRIIEPFLLSQKVVMQSGVPVLVIPICPFPPSVGQNILVAWDGSHEAARAVRDSLPLLRQAGHVSLLAIDPHGQSYIRSGADPATMAAHLERHGIKAETMETVSEQKTVTDVLLARIAEVGADLLVMGAFGHSRLKEFLLGGVTYDLLLKLPVPVLMSH
jgi:nucleotide-binding universal stress UspA family protein